MTYFAYIDGGTGSMALQILLASLLSAVYAFHSGWAKIKQRFFKAPPAEEKSK